MFTRKTIFTCLLTVSPLVTTGVLSAGRAQAQPSGINADLVGRWDGHPGAYSDVWGDGDYAFVPNYTQVDGLNARVYVIDISDPVNPVVATTFYLPAPNQFASPQDVKVGDGLLFIALDADPNDGAAIVDIRTPASPVQVATVRVPGFSSIHNLFYDSGFLYLPTDASIAIVDLTSFNPDNPPPSPITTAKWILTGVGSSRVHDVTAKNGRLYAAAWDSGLWIYDVSDVANTMPTFLGSVGGENTHSMWPTDDGKFVVTGEERTGGGIKVYEIIDNGGSVTLVLRDSLVLPGASSVHNQVIIGNRLYNSWYEQGLQVFDIDPATGLLEFAASFEISYCWGVYPFLGEDRILLSDKYDGLYIVTLGQGTEVVVLPPAPDDTRKNRYISIDPSPNGAASTALRVILTSMKRCRDLSAESCSTSSDCPSVCENDNTIECSDAGDCSQVGGGCVSSGPCEQHPEVGSGVGWVAVPFDPSCQNADGTPTGQSCLEENLVARVVAEPVFRMWSETLIHIGDCEIVPVASYEVRATPDGTVFGLPLEVGTIAKPGARHYGDAVGTGTGDMPPLLGFTPPNGVVNVTDTQAFILTAQGTSTPSVPVTWVDLHGLDPGTAPNGILNISDLQRIKFGFEGLPYTKTPGQLTPGTCP